MQPLHNMEGDALLLRSYSAKEIYYPRCSIINVLTSLTTVDFGVWFFVSSGNLL